MREQFEEYGVGEGLGVGVEVAEEGVGEAGEAGVDVLAAALHEAVGVEDEGEPRENVVVAWGRRIGSGRASRGGSVARSRNSTRPSGWTRAGGG